MLTMLTALTLAAPAHAWRGAPATLTVDNDLFTPISVFVDGALVGRVPPRVTVDLRVRPGSHAVRLVQDGRRCVLSADVLDLPPASSAFYEIDRGCTPVSWRSRWSYGFRSHHWQNTWASWRPGSLAVTSSVPSRFRVREHHGCVRAPEVRVGQGVHPGPPSRGSHWDRDRDDRRDRDGRWDRDDRWDHDDRRGRGGRWDRDDDDWDDDDWDDDDRRRGRRGDWDDRDDDRRGHNHRGPRSR